MPGPLRPDLTPERWARVRALLDRALDYPAERSTLLASVRAADTTLFYHLERALEEHDLDEEDSSADRPDAFVNLAGRKIGPYKLDHELGRGGMGTVFLAYREDADVSRPVALKLLRQSFAEESPRRAFQRERSILVALDHPGIARLLDWGTVPGGLLYLVLEYVDGRPITDYCAQERLSLPARLALFQQVCAAVQYAHQHLVVHRDLKPSNILVGSDGKAKLLDFGISGRLDSSTISNTLQTRLTPTYASPEQLRGKAITVSNDIYSLGVLLFEMLTGSSPYVLNGNGVEEVANAVLEQEPQPPSRKAALPLVAGRDLVGDIDNIVLKALRKEVDQRYQSVKQISDDIDAYLHDRPVGASSGTTTYRIARFVRRNRLSVALGMLAFGALILGGTISTWKWREAEKNRKIADSRYQALRTFTRSTITALEYSSGGVASAQTISNAVVLQLDQLSRDQLEDDGLQSDIAAAYEKLGETKGQLFVRSSGDAAGAAVSFRKANAIRVTQWTARPDQAHGIALIENYINLGRVLPDPQTGAAVMLQGVEVANNLVSKYPNVREVRHELASVTLNRGVRLIDEGDLQGSSECFRQAITISRRNIEQEGLNPFDLNDWMVGVVDMSLSLRTAGDFEGALAMIRDGSSLASRMLAIRNTVKSRREIANITQHQGVALFKLKRYTEAERNLRDSIKQFEALISEDGSNEQLKYDLTRTQVRMGELLFDTGRREEALRNYMDALRVGAMQSAHDPNNYLAQRGYADSLNRLSDALLKMRRDTSTAAEQFREADRICQKFLVLAPSGYRTSVLLAVSKRGEAEAELQLKADGYRKRYVSFLKESVDVFRGARARAPFDVDLAARAKEAEQTLAVALRH